MSLGTDFCPYCDYELEYDDVFEPADVDGSEEFVEVECTNCGRIMRASIELMPCLTLVEEESYLADLKMRRDRNMARLDDKYFENHKHFILEDIEILDLEIKQSQKNLKINSEVE